MFALLDRIFGFHLRTSGGLENEVMEPQRILPPRTIRPQKTALRTWYT
jgi:hypothetical protein